MKLLHNARQKYLEMEGVEMPAARPDGSTTATAAREEEIVEEEAVAPEDSESIPVTKVSQPEELGLPAHMELLSQESLTVHGSSAAFYESCRRALVGTLTHLTTPYCILCCVTVHSTVYPSSRGGAHLCPHCSGERRR